MNKDNINIDDLPEKPLVLSDHLLYNTSIIEDAIDAWARECASAALAAAVTGQQPVPGAIWYEGSVSLIRRGAEDAYCASHPGAERIYFGAARSAQEEPRNV